jgi:hypothetical protein
MSSLANQQQNLSFSGLLQVPGGITSTLQQVQDGDGNVTGLSLSSAGASVTTSSTFQASENGTTITGAIPRLISDGFGDIINVKDFGAIGDGVTDDTAAIQTALNYWVANHVDLVFPSGTYRTSSTLTASFLGATLYGKKCLTFTSATIKADSFVGAVLNIGTGSIWATGAIVIDGYTAIPTGGAIVPGQIGFKQGVNTTTDASTGLIMRNCNVTNFDTGYYLQGTQFSAFESILASACTTGAYLMQPSLTVQGGNNNIFNNCYFFANVVGLIIDSFAASGMNACEFHNLVTHACSVCGVYINGNSGVYITNWAPEAIGTSSPVTIFGNIIKNSVLQCVSSNVTLKNYVHSSNTLTIQLETSSALRLDNISGAAFQVVADDTSMVSGSEPFAKTGNNFSFTCLSPPSMIDGGLQGHIVAEPQITIDTSFPNTAPGEVNLGTQSGSTAPVAYTIDPLQGRILQATFTTPSLTLVVYTHTATYSAIGTVIVFAANFKSDIDATYSFACWGSTATRTVFLEAGKWVRVFIKGTTTVVNRFPALAITSDTAGSVLAMNKVHSFVSTDRRKYATFFAKSIFNPNLQPATSQDPDNGDASVTLDLLSSSKVQVFNTILTANRTVTFPTFSSTAIVGSKYGATYKVVRGASATGAFNLTVNGAKALTTAGEWVEYTYTGSAWTETGYGTL